MKLFINTCLDEVMIALVDNDQLLGFKTWQADRQESRKLTPRIAETLRESSVNKRKIKEVYVVTGPGSFTAVRIGFIVARAFADSLQAKMFMCNTFEFLSELYSDEHEYLELKAGGGNVYIIETRDGSYEIGESLGNTSASDLDVGKKFKENYLSVLENMILIEDISELEPNYVKEPNITVAKG